ncbi:MAG: adenylate/guanylate cyclase domain-containing protein [bacterium]
MPRADASQIIAEISRWLATDARMIDDAGARDQAFVDQLRQAGLPIARFVVGVRSLHPQVDAFSSRWEEGKAMEFRGHLLGDMSERERRLNPLFLAVQNGDNSRHRIDRAPAAEESSIFDDLRDAGMTDYVVVALPFSDDSNKAMTFATRAPRGFDADQIAILHGIAPAFACMAEVRYLRHLAGVLMDTYVGPVAGRKVLDGAIRRGSSETIRAAIWFCDLKGFTALSERLGCDALLDTLNCYFDVMTAAIEAEGGEVLKFIGDAILAIFQPSDDVDHGADRNVDHDTDGVVDRDVDRDVNSDADRDAAARALAAARAAVEALAEANRVRAEAGQARFECGIALHFGDVLYGNVGGQRRLDFTVIGPAVNLASRIESLTRELARPVLVSAPFAAMHGGAFEALGAFAFKGIAKQREVLAPRAR